MAGTYASIMALLAMVVVLLQAMKNQAGFNETLPLAFAWMALFAAIGLLLGAIARRTVDQSVIKFVETELQRLAPEANQESSES